MRLQIATLVTGFLKENLEPKVLVAGLQARKTEAVQVQVRSRYGSHMQCALTDRHRYRNRRRHRHKRTYGGAESGNICGYGQSS